MKGTQNVYIENIPYLDGEADESERVCECVCHVESSTENLFLGWALPQFSAGIPFKCIKRLESELVQKNYTKFIQLRLSQKNAIVYVTHLEQVCIYVFGKKCRKCGRGTTSTRF